MSYGRSREPGTLGQTPRHSTAGPSTDSRARAYSAHDRTRTCTSFRTLVPQTSLSTNSSTWALHAARLRMPGNLRHGEPTRNRQCSGRDSNPHGVNPHRILNPARLPIPPPERAPACRRAGPDGAEGSRTPDLLNAIQALAQLSYGPETANVTRPVRRAGTAAPGSVTRVLDRRETRSTTRFFKQPPAGLTGLEPAASGVTDRHSNRTELQPLFACPPGDRPRAIPSRGIEPRSPP